MSENLNATQFYCLAKKLLDKYEEGESFLLGDVYRQVRAAYDKFPEDTVIKQMASMLEKMAERQSPATIINQRQLTAAYNDLVRLSSETKFRLVLGHLVFAAPETKRVVAGTGLHDSCDGLDLKSLVDPEERRILEATFDDAAGRSASRELTERGAKYVKAELKSLGFSDARVKLAQGDADRLMYQAAFDTVKGMVSVYVPVKVAGGKCVLPTSFIDDQGEQVLNAIVLGDSLERRGGKAEAKNLFSYASVEETMLETPVVELPKELAHLASDFENTVLETTSTFGKKAVDAGKKLVLGELKAAGFKNAQVKYGSDSNDAVIFLAGINSAHGKLELEVPVEMKATADYQFVPLLPAFFAYQETLQDFTPENLQKFALAPHNPSCSTDSGLFGYMLLPELKEAMVKAASANQFETCEDILTHIGSTFAEEDYKNAIADYQYVLSIKSRAQSTAEHDQVIAKYAGVVIPAGKGSLRPRLANGRAINDVVVDADGRIRSAVEVEKERLNPIDEGGALISSSQILFS